LARSALPFKVSVARFWDSATDIVEMHESCFGGKTFPRKVSAQRVLPLSGPRGDRSGWDPCGGSGRGRRVLLGPPMLGCPGQRGVFPALRLCFCLHSFTCV
jgi:hypothetical protein